MSNATATVAVTKNISMIAAATEAYLGYIDMIFGDEDEIVATESKKGDKNLAKAEANYEKQGRNANDAKEDLKAKSINNGKTKMVGTTNVTVLKKKTIGESLSQILKAIKEFFLSLFGQRIPSSIEVPVLHTEPKIDEMLNDIERSYNAMLHANTTEAWDEAYAEFKDQVKNFGSRLAKCRKELAGNEENLARMRKEKVAPRKQLSALEKMNGAQFDDVKKLEAVHKDLVKVYQDLASFYDSKTVRKFWKPWQKKELSASDLSKKTAGTFNHKERMVGKDMKKAAKSIDKNQQRINAYQQKYGATES